MVGFLFEKGRFTDFRFPDAVLTIPWSINDRSQIAGIYAGGDGTRRCPRNGVVAGSPDDAPEDTAE